MRKTVLVVNIAVMALAGFMVYGWLKAPRARVVIGGLAASTLITLVFVPTVYTIFEEGWKGLRSGLPKHS